MKSYKMLATMSDMNSIWLVKSPVKDEQELFRQSTISFSSEEIPLDNKSLKNSKDEVKATSTSPLNQENDQTILEEDITQERYEELLVDGSDVSNHASHDILKDDLDLNPVISSDQSQEQLSEVKEAPALP